MRGIRRIKIRCCGVVMLIVLCIGLIIPSVAQAADQVRWHTYNQGLALGKRKHKRILVHFYATWCFYCRKMAKETFQNGGVVSYIEQNFIPIRVDISKEKRTSSRYGVRAVPDTWFLTEVGKGIGHVPGMVLPDRFLQLLKQAKAMSVE
jgi:thioredoxin-related protein